MYKTGDYIYYGNCGICKIADIGLPEIAHIDREKVYYTLTPVYSTEVIYTPVDTAAFIRPVISRQEAEQLIEQMPSIQGEVVNIKNLQLLSQHYQSSIETHDCGDLVRLLKTVYSKNKDAKRSGKNPGQMDERYRKRAEDLLYGELAIALEISREDVLDYIKVKLDGSPSHNPEERFKTA